MKRILLFSLLNFILLYSINYTAIAQESKLSLKIYSGPRMLHYENVYWEDLVSDLYISKMDEIKENILKIIRPAFNHISNGQTMYSEIIELSPKPRIHVTEMNNKLYVVCFFIKNKIEFKVTTPDKFGIGFGKEYDPKGEINFGVVANFELKHKGSAESMKLLNPNWYVVNIWRPDSEGFLEIDDNHMVYITTKLEKATPFYVLNDMNNILIDNIHSIINNNPELHKEYAIDEDKNLDFNPDITTQSLVFQHNYSKTGIVKRTSTEDAKIILEGPESTISTSPVSTPSSPISMPVSTSPSKINKKANAVNSRISNRIPAQNRK